MSSVNFENTAVAFQHKNNGQLKRSFWLFKLIASPALVKLGSSLTNLAVGLGIPIGWAIKKNIFTQFCGGVNISESKKSIKSKTLMISLIKLFKIKLEI